ncbi:unnamed protein product [Calypogeia fissa]
MDKESVLKTWYRVQREIQEYWTTSSCPSSTNFKGDRPTQVETAGAFFYVLLSMVLLLQKYNAFLLPLFCGI